MQDRDGDRQEVAADAEKRGGGGEAAERKEELVGGSSSEGRSPGGQEHQEVLDGEQRPCMSPARASNHRPEGHHVQNLLRFHDC